MSTGTHPTENVTTEPAVYSGPPQAPAGRDGKPLGGKFVGAAANYLDERTSMSGLVKELGRKIFPDHWSFMLGEIALWSFVVVLLSGTFLTFFFQASMVETHYNGAYEPMRGIAMSAAMESALHISFDLRGGLLVRQIHHWAAWCSSPVSACTCCASSSRARSASRASSTGWSASSCSSSRWPRASPATRSPTTCSRATVCASSTA